MRINTVLGIILIAVGIAAFVRRLANVGIITREKAVDLGPLQVTTEKTHSIPLPPIVGVITLVGGIVLLIVNKRKT